MWDFNLNLWLFAKIFSCCRHFDFNNIVFTNIFYIISYSRNRSIYKNQKSPLSVRIITAIFAAIPDISVRMCGFAGNHKVTGKVKPTLRICQSCDTILGKHWLSTSPRENREREAFFLCDFLRIQSGTFQGNMWFNQRFLRVTAVVRVFNHLESFAKNDIIL